MRYDVCGYCVQELEKQHPDLKKQLEAVAVSQNVKLSHGMCLDHMVDMYRQAKFPEEKIQQTLQKKAEQPTLVNLGKHPEILQQFLQGDFTHAYGPSLAQQQTTLKERLQKRANIVKEIKTHASSSRH